MKTDQLLQQLADKLQVTVEHLWTVLLKQVYFDACTNLVVAGFSALIMVALYFIWKAKRKDIDDSYTPELFYMIAIIIVLFCSVLIACCITEAVGQFTNPEYYALKIILDK